MSSAFVTLAGTNEIRGQFPEIYIRTGVSVHA